MQSFFFHFRLLIMLLGSFTCHSHTCPFTFIILICIRGDNQVCLILLYTMYMLYIHAHMNTYTQCANEYTKRLTMSQLGATAYNFHFDCFSFSGVMWVVLVGTIVQCSGKVQNGNDILQEKFQPRSDNHFYRIKS